METFELRYFLAVAKHQNVHRAAVERSISPGSLSKAVTRLEDELGVKLFRRTGRNIELTEHGLALQRRAAEIIHLEEATRLEISGHKSRLHVTIAGPEIVLSGLAMQLVTQLRQSHKNAAIEFLPANDETTLALVAQGTAHLGLTTISVPRGLKSKSLASCTFLTCVGKGHALYPAAKAGKTLPIAQLLEHAFVCPSYGILGKIDDARAADGWREDIFPRRVDFVTSSLKLIEDLVASGNAVAYLPDYLVAKLGALPLKISGCPYTCRQEVRMIAKNPKDTGWLNQLF